MGKRKAKDGDLPTKWFGALPPIEYNKYSYLEQRPRKKAVVDSDKYSMEQFDSDICDLFSNNREGEGGYLGLGFVSSSGHQFFDDEKILACFEYHLAGLQRLIQYTRKKKDQNLPSPSELDEMGEIELPEERIMRKYE